MAALIRLFGWLLLLSLLIWAVLIITGYAVLVASVGAVWALKDARARSKGRPYVEPKQRFIAVWSRGVSPIDPKHWITPETQPAVDPHLLPGQVTGELRVENLGVERDDEPGPLERFVIHARIHNHGATLVNLDDIDHVDLQLWTAGGHVVGSDTTWSEIELHPGHSCETTISTRVIDQQQMQHWAISHRGANGQYIFFNLAAATVDEPGQPQETPGP